MDRLSFMNFLGFPEDIPDFTFDRMVFQRAVGEDR
ncbi:hypothetical protein C5S30_06890 [ANME-1 cluster archaeon GoMg4]|nr:hypothetical protein [ANME-1 cluster archaeon GoMg4]